MREISLQVDFGSWIEIPEPGRPWSAHDELERVFKEIPGSVAPSGPPQGLIQLLESARLLGRSADLIWRFVLLAGPQVSPTLVEFRDVDPEGLQRMVLEVDRESREGRVEADAVRLGDWVGRRYGRIYDPQWTDETWKGDASTEQALYAGLVYLLASEVHQSNAAVGLCISVVTSRLDLLPLIARELEARLPTLSIS